MSDRPHPPSVTAVVKQLVEYRLGMYGPSNEPPPEWICNEAAKQAIAEYREGKIEDIRVRASEIVNDIRVFSPHPLQNFSGVILNTGLGRAVLPGQVWAHLSSTIRHAVNLEIDLETGGRGDRNVHVEKLLCDLTGAEAAMVVNNCAGAVYLALSALCRDREVILSRGQMVEIGGSFRMPDVIRDTGCHLVEVGCTNKTHLRDFQAALTENTAAILWCHESNYKITGFTSQPNPADLADLAHRNGALFIDDAGTGCLINTEQFGIGHERTLQEAVAAGADVVMASGDKLIGGPQAGIILGKKEIIAALKKHPLARVLRIDKLCLAGLNATLKLYRSDAWKTIPLWECVSRPLEQVREVAERLAKEYPEAITQEGITEIGGGSCPGKGIPTVLVGIKSDNLEELHRYFRTNFHMVGSVRDGYLWFDPRSVCSPEIGWVNLNVVMPGDD
ncbi:MAG: L-seryl-tRNA(Sec) selenium transferase [Armatimonadetes bacterium]|nr:L-seryl-tRNA(Sec) selenium transferase [Armatimonadota bacterium]